MVFKDHLVALWRTQRRFALATRLAGTRFGDRGRRGHDRWDHRWSPRSLHRAGWSRWEWRWRWASRGCARPSVACTGAGRCPPAAAPRRAGRRVQVVVGAALVLAIGGVGVWTATRGETGARRHHRRPTGCPSRGAPVPTCEPSAAYRRARRSTSTSSPPPATRRARCARFDDVRELVTLAKEAGAAGDLHDRVVHDHAARTPGGPIRFELRRPHHRRRPLRRAAGPAPAGRHARLGARRPAVPRASRRAPTPSCSGGPSFVTELMQHVNGKVDYLEVWNEPNDAKWWPTGPDPMEFARLLGVTYTAVHTVSPTTQVVSGGLAGNDIGYLEQGLRGASRTLGLKASPFDMVGAHPFSGGRRARRRSTRPSATTATRTASIDENFTGFIGAARRDGRARRRRPAGLHHPVRLQHPGGARAARRCPTTLRAQLPHPGAQADDLRAATSRSSPGTPCTRRRGTRRSTRCWTSRPAQPDLRRPGGVGREGRRGGCRRVTPRLTGRILPKRPPTRRRSADRLGLVDSVRSSGRIGGAGCSWHACSACPLAASRAQGLPVRPRGQRARALPPRHRLRAVRLPAVPGAARPASGPRRAGTAAVSRP